MTDHKFTDDDVIKALECCLNGNINKSQVEVCSPCPFFHDGNCTDLLKQNALALINRQKEEIESLQAIHADMLESLRLASEANKDMQAEIERLNSENKVLIENDVRNKYPNCVSVEKGRIYTRTLEDYDELIGDISAEAIKEFAKNVKKHFYQAELIEYIDSLVEEVEMGAR